MADAAGASSAPPAAAAESRTAANLLSVALVEFASEAQPPRAQADVEHGTVVDARDFSPANAVATPAEIAAIHKKR